MPNIKGVEASEEELYGCLVTTVDIKTEWAAKHLDRRVGQYITIQAPVTFHDNIEIAEVGECLAAVLDRVLQPYYQKKLCICGLGHYTIPADSLGSEVASRLPLSVFTKLGTTGNFQAVYSFSPGTQMTNGTKTEAIVGGVLQAVGADCLLLVDSCMTKEPARLFRTIQLSTSGGTDHYSSGQMGEWSSLGVPVISLCVPTTIPLSLLHPGQDQGQMMLTDIHIKEIVTAASTVIAYGIMRVCWPYMSKEECFIFAKGPGDPIPYSSLWLQEGERGNSEDAL